MPPALKRALSLPLLTLYGVGTIVGAGFYALLGEVAGQAGTAAPTAVLLAALVAWLSAYTFARLAARYPESGGPVRYVEAAFKSARLAQLVGLLVILTGVVSAATLSKAVGGFVDELYGLPAVLPTVLTVVVLGAIASWGIRAAGYVAGAITLLEVAGLILVLAARGDALAELPARAAELVPAGPAEWPGVLLGSFLVFYAFIGFEDMVTLSEEVVDPRRNVPRAILGALLVTTALYVAVAAVAVLAMDPSELARHRAPLAALVGARGETARLALGWIGILAGVNGALVQIVMAARIVYGLRTHGRLLGWLGAVHARTRTPLRATVLACALVLALALGLPLVTLALWTSAILLTVFALVHLALLVLIQRGEIACGRWIPVLGLLSCAAFVVTKLVLDL